MARSWLLSILTLVPLTAGLSATSHVEQCPLVVDSVSSVGISAKIAFHNEAGFPVRVLVFHITYADPLGAYHEDTVRSDMLIQPYQRLSVETPPMTKAIVVWSTLGASISCKAVDN